MIRYLTDKEIDPEKWDACVEQATNGFVYACTDCLSTMTSRWSALILDDYEAIFPLPWRKKWGIKYVYPPAFTQQLGLISRTKTSPALLDEFIKSLSQHFRFADMNLNEENLELKINHIRRKNYLLHLNQSYELLEASFSRSAKRNITKAKTAGISIKDNIDLHEIVNIHYSRFIHKIAASKEDYGRLAKWLTLLSNKNSLFVIGAYDPYGTLLAGSIFIRFKERLTFILNGNTEKSMECGATHLLMDHCIRKHAGTGLILDFEGSDNPDFARFYEQYGAHAVHYPFVRINNLPFFFRSFKRDASSTLLI